MTWRHYLLLAVLGLALLGLISAFQSSPGYMDADYYYAGGVQLVQGRGFSEPYLWNYLDDPAGLPHPSHGYWMPLASMLVAAGAALFGPSSWTAGRIGFLLVGAAVPPLTAALAWRLTSRRNLAWISGLLAIFSAFYLPFLPVTDTFGLYMLLGGVFFLLTTWIPVQDRKIPLPLIAGLLGLTAGGMHLTRADGLLWLLIACVGIILFREPHQQKRLTWWSCTAVLGGYLLVMGPWFIRNELAFGSPLGPGGSKMLWLTSYDQIFAFPASQLSFANWWQSGIASILKARWWALGINLQRTLAEQGEIFLLPFIAIGFWHLRREKKIQLAGLAWLLTLAAMSFIFPFAGARGGFFHSGAALQPVWWALAPFGLDRALAWVSRKRGWDPARAGRFFQPTLVGLAALLSVGLLAGRLIDSSASSPAARVGKWNQGGLAYQQIDQYLLSQGAAQSDIVMVANPPGFYLATGNPAIAIPDGDTATLLDVARRYGAKYLVMEENSIPSGVMILYDQPDGSSEPIYLGNVADARIFEFSDR